MKRHAATVTLLGALACAAEPCFYEPNLHAKELYREGKYTQAADLSRAIVKDLSAAKNPDCRLAIALTNLGAAHQQMGEVVHSDRELRKAAQTWERMGPEGEAGLLRVRSNLLSLYVENGLHTKAERLVPRILAMPIATLTPTPLDHAHILNNLASVCYATRKHRQARTQYEEAIAILEKTGATEPEMAYVLNNFSRLLIETREYSLAGDYIAQAISILENKFGREHPELIKPLMNSAEVARLTGRTTDAEVTLARAIDLSERTLGVHHPQTGEVLASYGRILHQLGRKQEAHLLRVKADEILAAHRHSARSLTNSIEISELAPHSR